MSVDCQTTAAELFHTISIKRKDSFLDLVSRALRLPAFAHIYALDLDRLLRTEGEPPITFSVNGFTSKDGATATVLEIDNYLRQPPTPTGANVIYSAEKLLQSGQRTPGLVHAFTHARGAEINGLNILYANHATQSPRLRLYFLNKYLSKYRQSIDLAQGLDTEFFSRIRNHKTRNKVAGPLVTVIMPAHNAAATIDLAVTSLLKQSWHNLQIIIVDDASSDGTFEKAQALAMQDSRIQILGTSVNVGPYVCRNLAVQHARGHWLTVHDADDWAFPDRIEQQVKALTAANTVACTAGMLRMNQRGQITRPYKTQTLNDDGYQRLCFASLMVETKYFRTQLGAWDSVWVAGDAEMFARLEVLAIHPTHIGQPLMLCLDHSGSLTNHPELGLLSETGSMNAHRMDYRNGFSAWHSSAKYKKMPIYCKERQFKAPIDMMVKLNDIQRVLHEQKTQREREISERTSHLSFAQSLRPIRLVSRSDKLKNIKKRYEIHDIGLARAAYALLSLCFPPRQAHTTTEIDHKENKKPRRHAYVIKLFIRYLLTNDATPSSPERDLLANQLRTIVLTRSKFVEILSVIVYLGNAFDLKAVLHFMLDFGISDDPIAGTILDRLITESTAADLFYLSDVYSIVDGVNTQNLIKRGCKIAQNKDLRARIRNTIWDKVKTHIHANRSLSTGQNRLVFVLSRLFSGALKSNSHYVLLKNTLKLVDLINEHRSNAIDVEILITGERSFHGTDDCLYSVNEKDLYAFARHLKSDVCCVSKVISFPSSAQHSTTTVRKCEYLNDAFSYLKTRAPFATVFLGGTFDSKTFRAKVFSEYPVLFLPTTSSTDNSFGELDLFLDVIRRINPTHRKEILDSGISPDKVVYWNKPYFREDFPSCKTRTSPMDNVGYVVSAMTGSRLLNWYFQLNHNDRDALIATFRDKNLHWMLVGIEDPVFRKYKTRDITFSRFAEERIINVGYTSDLNWYLKHAVALWLPLKGGATTAAMAILSGIPVITPNGADASNFLSEELLYNTLQQGLGKIESVSANEARYKIAVQTSALNLEEMFNVRKSSQKFANILHKLKELAR